MAYLAQKPERFRAKVIQIRKYFYLFNPLKNLFNEGKHFYDKQTFYRCDDSNVC